MHPKSHTLLEVHVFMTRKGQIQKHIGSLSIIHVMRIYYALKCDTFLFSIDFWFMGLYNIFTKYF